MERLKGIAASPGLAVGPAFVMEKDTTRAIRRQTTNPEAEIQRLQAAIATATAELEALRDRTAGVAADLLDAHLLFLADPTLVDAAEERIRSERVTADWALHQTAEAVAAMLSEVDDPYLSGRAADVRDVASRIMRHLTGDEPVALGDLRAPSIIIAHDLTPSQTASLDRSLILGFATEQGGDTGHTAILARALGIPAIVGVPGATASAIHGDQVILDGTAGELTLRPDPTEILRAKLRMAQRARPRTPIAAAVTPTETADGVRIELGVNIGAPGEAVEALHWGAEAVGLFRTEFLYMQQADLPSEEEQVTAYTHVLSAMGPERPVTIRTLDAGGDKPVSALMLPQETNPFLGLRAIRLTLAEPELFRTQLRALLRAAAAGRLRIMYPMVQSVAEITAANRLLAEAQAELEGAGVTVRAPEVGIMVETPAAAATIDLLLPHVAFVSIGTNDLTQYTLAVDRMNAQVADRYDPFHPAVLRLIHQICRAAADAGKPVSVCGEMAADPAAALVLLGLGVTKLSMSRPALAPVRQAVRAVTLAEATSFAASLLHIADPVEIRRQAEAFLGGLTRGR